MPTMEAASAFPLSENTANVLSPMLQFRSAGQIQSDIMQVLRQEVRKLASK